MNENGTRDLRETMLLFEHELKAWKSWLTPRNNFLYKITEGTDLKKWLFGSGAYWFGKWDIISLPLSGEKFWNISKLNEKLTISKVNN